jgi:hypothetical protein
MSQGQFRKIANVKIEEALKVIDLMKSQWDLDVLHDQLDDLKIILNFESGLDEWSKNHINKTDQDGIGEWHRGWFGGLCE